MLLNHPVPNPHPRREHCQGPLQAHRSLLSLEDLPKPKLDTASTKLTEFVANLRLPTLLKHKPYPFNNQVHLSKTLPYQSFKTQQLSPTSRSFQLRIPLTNAEAGRLQKQGRWARSLGSRSTVQRAAQKLKCPTPYTIFSRPSSQHTELQRLDGGLFRRCSSRTPLPPGKGVPAGIHASAKNDAPRTRHSSGTFTADGPWLEAPAHPLGADFNDGLLNTGLPEKGLDPGQGRAS